MANVDQAIAAHTNEIKSQPYAKYIVAEDTIDRVFGYKIIRQQVSAGKNSLVYKCETAKRPGDVYCLIKAYKMGKDKIKNNLREETCQIMRYVTGKCAQIISTYELYYTNEKIYLISDWSAKGEVLNNLRHRTIRLNEAMLKNWTNDLLSAVNFLHSNAICHRNIAPSCLLLTQDSRIKIGTLGDAVVYCKPDGSLIKQKWPKFSKTANWNQAPEVAKGKLYDPRRADIWSIGATLYWFITRGHPINYTTQQKLTKQLDHHLEYLPKVTKRCHAFVKKMLTYQPSSRPTIAAAMQHDWVTGSGKPSPSTGKEATAEIGITEKKEEDPGEAAGPDEAQAEVPDPSSSKKKDVSGNQAAETSDKQASGATEDANASAE